MDVISRLIMERLLIIFSVISGLWIVTGWRHVWSWLVYLIDPPNFWVSHHWPAGCIKREENVINIAKPCIHKAAGSGINGMLFTIFSWRYMLFIIHDTRLDKYRAQYHKPIYSNLASFHTNLFLCTPKNSKAYVFM